MIFNITVNQYLTTIVNDKQNAQKVNRRNGNVVREKNAQNLLINLREALIATKFGTHVRIETRLALT